jgi:hypothetical protein
VPCYLTLLTKSSPRERPASLTHPPYPPLYTPVATYRLIAATVRSMSAWVL